MARASISVGPVTVELLDDRLALFPKHVQATISPAAPALGVASQVPNGTAYVIVGGHRGDAKVDPADKTKVISKGDVMKWECDVHVTAQSPGEAAGMKLGFVQNLVSSVRRASYAGGRTVTEEPTAQQASQRQVFLDSGPQKQRLPWYKLESPTTYADKVLFGQTRWPGGVVHDIAGGPYWVELDRLLREPATRGTVTLTTSDGPQFAAPLSLGNDRHLAAVRWEDAFILYLVLQHGSPATYVALAAAPWGTTVEFQMRDPTTGLTLQNTEARRTEWVTERRKAKLDSYETEAKKRKYPLMTRTDWRQHFHDRKRAVLHMRLAPQFGLLTERQVSSGGIQYKPATGAIAGMSVEPPTVHDIAQQITRA